MTSSTGYSLAPVFDVLPHPTQLGLQALIIGNEGRVSSVSNLLSTPERFGLGKDEARAIVTDVYAVVREASGFFEEAGCSGADISMLSNVCTRFESQLMARPA